MDRLWDIEELRNFIKNNSSSGITKDEVNKLIDEKINNVIKINKLWENNDQFNNFPQTQINLLYLYKYTKIIIYYKKFINDTNITNITLFLKDDSSTMRKLFFELKSKNDNGLNIRNIDIEPYSGKIIFYNNYFDDYKNGTSEENNEYNIPVLICGIY